VNTLSRRPCIHWADRKVPWLSREQAGAARVVGVELAHGAAPLADPTPARERTVVVLGPERSGIPDEAWEHLDEVVEIPMVGIGASLNVAVARSLVLRRLAGLA